MQSPDVPKDVFSQLHRYLLAMQDSELTREEQDALETLVCSDPAACDLYISYTAATAALRAWSADAALESEEELQLANAFSAAKASRGAPPSIHTVHQAETPSLPPDLTTPCIPDGALQPPLGVAAGPFSPGWPVAYLIATVIFGVAMAIGAFVHISQPMHPVTPSPSPIASAPDAASPTKLVGRITGMSGCQWSDPQTETMPGARVPLGRKYALSSGLMEITYDTGARVILQGPVTYEVESPTGGYLAVGKLTARLEKESGINANPKRQRGSRSESGRHQHSSDLCPLTSDLFSVRTPTAIVTDLGTEFGVEVTKEGNTTSHVFRGSVELRTASLDKSATPSIRVLHANESASVEGSEGSGIHRTILSVPAANAAVFARSLPTKTPKTLDLVDIVAGGDGFSGKCNQGIDSTDGRIVAEWPAKPSPWPMSDGRYHRVERLPMIDGVFVPCPRLGPVIVDSAGHTFTDCPETDGDTSGVLWAGGAPMSPRFVPPTKSGTIDYGAGKHRFFFIHANKGITFDLDAIRRGVPGCRLTRFRSVAGNTETASLKGQSVLADFFVLLDGRVRFQRRQFNAFNNAATVTVAIADSDRFLTLVATDSGDSIQYDWIVFGDPRLELEAKPFSKNILENK